jgi:hypothetical protein
MPHGFQYRLADDAKNAVKEELRAVLRTLAREQRIATYSEVTEQLSSARLHPGSYIFSHLLREVCGEEEAMGHGILCALVVSKATGMPGAGYFVGTARADRDMSDQIALWQADVQAVFEIWSGK